MNETTLTIVGNVVTDITGTSTRTGIETASFRLASTTRRYDRGISQWVDGDTSYVKVVCWRRLARHVVESLAKGDPVVVVGRLRVREWQSDDGRRGVVVEIDASHVGHDLSRGVTRFTRPPRPAEVADGTVGAGSVEVPETKDEAA